jgi:hypothetical protein
VASRLSSIFSRPRTALRLVAGGTVVALIAVLLLVNLSVIGQALGGQGERNAALRAHADHPPGEQSSVATGEYLPRQGLTVISSDTFGAGVRSVTGDLVAVVPNGSVLYQANRYQSYWDVDPTPAGNRTALYTASETLNGSEVECNSETACLRNRIERVNFTTGDRTRLFSRISPTSHGAEWHDVDRINDTHYLVAGMRLDRTFIVNVETGIITWQWDAQEAFAIASGGPYPEDWTHLNDVEAIDAPAGSGENGTWIMASPRNQDRVIFIDLDEGIERDWTLGSEDELSILYEQHNPDFIPQENGGPAVVVGDSENNRVIEYQRRDGSWEQTWVWDNGRLQWPRDADRLPNGHTLVTDSNGGRVIDVAPNGSVVWTLPIDHPYEAERFGTSPESGGGPSAVRAGLDSRRASSSEAGLIRSVLPPRVFNGLLTVLPWWLSILSAGVLVVLVGVLLVWGAIEAWWSSVTLQVPIKRRN